MVFEQATGTLHRIQPIAAAADEQGQQFRVGEGFGAQLDKLLPRTIVLGPMFDCHSASVGVRASGGHRKLPRDLVGKYSCYG